MLNYSENAFERYPYHRDWFRIHEMAKISLFSSFCAKNDIKSSISTGRRPNFAFFEVDARVLTPNYPRNVENGAPDIAQYLTKLRTDGRTHGRTHGRTFSEI
jgi:hypothetical protein